MPADSQPATWQRIAKRIRVPLGFVTAAVFLVFARPTLSTLLWSLALTLPGLWMRAYAAGFVKKNAELTMTGPYAFTRNPLYLGSLGLVLGFALAAGRVWLAVMVLVLFAVIYVPTILSEERFLRATFPEFAAYAQRVPRLLPRLTPASSMGGTGRFSTERYLHHREYNACMGTVAIYAVLVARMLLWHSR
jgi:protein-S-isoprenylcysteine O-methyltransferase Ste14